jgi:hypothetical protein
MSSITLTLPDQTLYQAHQAAHALQRPVEELLSEMLTAVLPPLDNVPSELQAELAAMTWASNNTLWQIAREQLSPIEQERLQQLSQMPHPTAEQIEQLDELRAAYGRVTLRKARAYALLSLRGGQALLK